MKAAFKPPFIQADFQITGLCNAKCSFCQCWQNKHSSQKELPAKVWIDTLKRLKMIAPIEFLCIGGGEPLLYKDIFKVIKGAVDLDICTVVISNGSLFSYDNCKKILDTGIKHIDFSLDAFSDKHNSMRGMNGLFEKCIEGINLLKKINPNISLKICTLICEENIYELPKFTDWALRELPIEGISFQAYSRVVVYEGKEWWRNDPLWPKDKDTIISVLNCLLDKAEKDTRILNDPLQFVKFKEYFLNPYNDLKISCPAGRLNFSVSYTGDIIGCMAEGSIGNITTDDPVEVYIERCEKVREKASLCKENCHFLINCYFPLHWKRWKELVKDMVKEEEVIYRPGRIIFPPEIRGITSSSKEGYPALIKYNAHKHLDVIGKYDNLEDRKIPYPYFADIPCIYFCGDTSEIHRWGVGLDENDFFKQLDKLKEVSSQHIDCNIIIGVRRTNFHRLDKVYKLIAETLRQKNTGILSFNIKPLKGIKKRFYQYLDEINKEKKDERIEFRVIDGQLDSLLAVIEKNAGVDDFNKNMFLRALGPVCKDVFIGPRFLLVDLSGGCNVNCVYCRSFSPWKKKYQGLPRPKLFQFLKFEVVKNILFEAKGLGVETILFVGGGEPTLHPQFREIINYIKSLEMKFNFSTNGTYLNLCNEALVDEKCGSVTVSFSFASKKTFKLIRPAANYKIMRNIERNVRELADLKKKYRMNSPCIIALYAICKYNYREIVKMAFHAKKLGANAIWYQLVHLEDFSKDKLYMPKDVMEKVKKLLKKAKILCERIDLKFESFIEFEMNHYDTKKGDWSKGGLLQQGCFVGWHFAFIHLYKEVFMCCGAITIGILDEGGKGLRDLWFSDVYRRYRNDALIMHKENPLGIYGKPLYGDFCDSCDNHDQNTMMIESIRKYELDKFVER